MRILILALLLALSGCATYQEPPQAAELRARSDAYYGEPEEAGRFLTWFDSLSIGGTSGSFGTNSGTSGSFGSFDGLNTGCIGPVIVGRCHGQPMPGGDTFIEQPNSPYPRPPGTIRQPRMPGTPIYRLGEHTCTGPIVAGVCHGAVL